jgi:Na+-translocating ferredoxin:NAD+ oxidoreductase subunit A
MSYIGVIFSFVFMNNVILNKLLGMPDTPQQKRVSLLGMLLLFALSLTSAIIGWLLWKMTRKADYVFLPSYCLYFLLVSILFEYMIRHTRPKISNVLSLELKRIEYSGIAFGLGAIIGQTRLNPVKAVIASAAAVCGYAAAQFILRKIMERLELSDVPRVFKGTPAMLLNAGLVSMAFLAIDQTLLKNLPV